MTTKNGFVISRKSVNIEENGVPCKLDKKSNSFLIMNNPYKTHLRDPENRGE